MNSKRNAFCMLLLIFVIGMGNVVFAQPVFENNTPAGFLIEDSKKTTRFATGGDVTVLVDLNEPANATYPVVGNFQKVERAVPFFSTASTAGTMDQAVVVDDNGVIHRAWIQQRGFVQSGITSSTPAYGVVYSKSFDGGRSFTDTISVSGSLRFDMITPSPTMVSGFSTMDLVVDSKGNPRVVYAMDQSADGIQGFTSAAQTVTWRGGAVSGNRSAYNNVFFNYSNDGGSSWLPSNNAVVVNDTTTINGAAYDGRKTAFPRMAISSTDDIFITYQRGMAAIASADVMLAKVDADSLQLGSAQPVRVGSAGTVGSLGGVRVDLNTAAGVSPDIAIGDDDVLHLTYYVPTTGVEAIKHKTVPVSAWDKIDAAGWDQDSPDNGATVGSFLSGTGVAAGTDNFGLDHSLITVNDGTIFNATQDHLLHLFPTVVIDRERSPDRVYVMWKHTDASSNAALFADENIAYNFYTYNGLTGGAVDWGSASFAFPTGEGSAAYQNSARGLFTNATQYQIEDNWVYTDRVAAVVDDRIGGTRGDLHIVFSGGPSFDSTNRSQAISATGLGGEATRLYYSRFNGTEWELPQVVATARNGVVGGVLAKHRAVFAPDISVRSGDDNVYLTFVGGSPRLSGSQIGNTARRRVSGQVSGMRGRGFATLKPGDISPFPYFKVIGRTLSFDDKSVPAGASQYHLTYTPINPLESGITSSVTTSAGRNNLVSILVGDNQDGTGIGGSNPGASAAPGGFLTGQWRYVGLNSLGVTSLEPGQSGAVFKGAISQNQASNDNGVFEGKIDDDGSNGFAEWGDDGDKKGLLVKLNVLGSDSSTNIRLVSASSAARAKGSAVNTTGEALADTSTQSVNIDGEAGDLGANLGTGTEPAASTFVKSIRNNGYELTQLQTVQTAPRGSYFILGPDIDIVAANASPSVSVVTPDANTLGAGGFANETFSIQYSLFDSDDNVTDTDGDTLRAALYSYPDNGLSSVQDIKTFGTLIVDERDVAGATTRLGTDPTGTGDFIEGSSSGNAQTYAWDDPGTAAQQAFGWGAVTKTLDGTYYIYIIADDGTNAPVFAVSSGALRVRHIPIVRSVSPVAADTTDTGEFNNLAKANPYNIKFTVDDYDDNAQMRLFIATESSIPSTSVTVTGTFPNQTLALAGATEIQLSDTLRTDEDIEFSFDVTAQGSARDSVIVQGNYFIYAVAADEDTFSLGVSSNALAIRHSPAYEFTSPLLGQVMPLDPSQQDRYTIEWQRGRSDQDLDGNAIISLYYTGVDPTVVNYSGTDSSQLLATSGTNPGNAVLVAGNIREDDEGANDQFVWNFRDPPGALPKVFKPRKTTIFAPNPHIVQSGSTVDTAWVYAVLHDTLGNTRVQAGGAILLRGGSESTYQPTPKVIMKTPPAGGQTIVNGDIVRLEWDDFLIDDGTGTDDAYLRLYAAPKGKYSTLTALESNAKGRGGALDVFVINSINGELAGDNNTEEAYSSTIKTVRESGDDFILWDTKTTSFKITGTPTEFDIFIAASVDPRFGDNVLVPSLVALQVDSVATGIGSQAQKGVLSKAPGALRVEGADPIYSIELGPGTMTAATGDTLEMDVLVNSQNSSIDLMAIHLNVPRNYFEVIDMDAGTTGLQPFADSTGAFKTPSTIAQNDTTQGTDQFIKLNFVESIINGEVVGNATGDSSQVAAKMKLLVKQYAGGAPLDTSLVWSTNSGRKTGFRRGTVELAAPAREVFVTLTPAARLIVTAPLEGRSSYADTLDVHLRQIGSTQDITDQIYIKANDVVLDTTSSSTDLDLSGVSGTFVVSETVTGVTSSATGTVTAVNGTVVSLSPVVGTFSAAESVTGGTSGAAGSVTTIAVGNVTVGDSVQVISDAFGTITLTEIPAGIYELAVKADGYISGRTDTLNLFDGLTVVADPTFGSDALGALSPATPLGFLRGGDATGDNQVDIADANLIFSIWNKTPADAGYVRAADVNADGVINSIDLGFVTANFGNDGFGAPPVFKRITEAGDNSVAMVEVQGVDEVEAWWPGRVFEVTTRVTGMSDVMAYDLGISYDPDRVKPLSSSQAVTEGDVFAENARGTLFFERSQPGLIEVTAGRVGRDMTASGDADLVTVRFVALADDPGVIEVVSGQLVNSAYQGVPMRVKKAQVLPQMAALFQNFPNPFNPSTEIRFDIPTARNVKLRVYNQLGQTVRTLVQSRMKAGSYRIKWDGRTEAGHGVSSGVYFYSLEAGDYSQIRKMTLVK